MRVLVTGGTGFVGRAVVERLSRVTGLTVRVAVRRSAESSAVHEVVRVGDLGPDADWGAALHDVQAVVHLSARAHQMRDTATDPLAEFRRVNTVGTEHLGRAAAVAGVQRLVFVSTIKVHGERGRFRETDAPVPMDPYAVSKLEAEQGLRRVADASSLEVVVIRPPLVYGPEVGANFAALMRAVARGIPLPLGAVRNRRSLVAVENLADLIAVTLTHPAAAGETYLVSDGEDLSTPELVRRLAAAMERRALLFPVPAAFLRAGAALTGRRAALERLMESLEADITKVRTELGWVPPLSVDAALRRAVEGMR